jgi:hypothetical protein
MGSNRIGTTLLEIRRRKRDADRLIAAAQLLMDMAKSNLSAVQERCDHRDHWPCKTGGTFCPDCGKRTLASEAAA